ncbi:Sensor histidine kinase desK [Gemella morbillorum]|uniref:sensor histidine kinase n=1 Tax=Gemella morbillorum TaxID=29391 RepID=UPI000DA3A76E|nr:sensor histidine kinase [Gemella morbillorum]UBH80331.1 sensor histidine kinase [Gemella morbillorum]SQH55721.1 Sensor histidine kinase desK [Gemella morbillorum]
MKKILAIMLKENFPFYISLVFFIFPFIYTITGTYPFYVLYFTIIAVIDYIVILYTKNKYIIFAQWSYLVFYVIYMTITIHPMNMLYSFYLSSLLIWRFHDNYTTYRTISFLGTINYLMIHISLASFNIADKVIMFFFYFLCLASYFLQKRNYEKELLKEERNKRNEHINILLAENERNRISQDLHDSIGHTFVMLKLKAELAEKYLEKNNIEAAKQELSEISKISKESMNNTRAIINKLKQRSIDEELHIIQDIMTMSNIQINVKNNIFSKPTTIQEWTLTMILKELANNVIKHSNATECDIIINEDKEQYSLLFSDNGCGFEKINGEELKSIKERLKAVNGKVNIISSKKPTTIKITIIKN